MNTKTDTTITTVRAIVAIFTVMLFVVLAVTAQAAPHGDYFSDQDSGTAFSDWLSEQEGSTLANCDSFNAIFSDNCGSFESADEFSNLAGVGAAFFDSTDTDEGSNESNNNEEEEIQISILDQRCVDGDGVVEFAVTNVHSYGLSLDGDIYRVGVNEDDADFLTHADLPNGSYEMSVFNNGEEASVTFTVDCEDEVTDAGTLSGQCSATPSEPEIDETVTWSMTVTGGDGSYNYEWTGAVSGNESQVETSYSTAGEKKAFGTVSSGDEFHSTLCSVDVQGDDGGDGDDDGQVQSARTIEEF
ncbi:MAG: hypothetical protein WD335_02250 [Candidatus Paceibacterota bacterium]